ncbi:MAG: rod shape-determining protein MreD [Gammaproteobacteria bacterium]|nr:rod shape-determining protein MreD [Gammaproteobacteria bacterium]
MATSSWRGVFAVIFSVIVAFILASVPLPDSVRDWRPAWVALVIIYWCLAIPERVGVLTAWTIGILLDVMQGTLLGQNALGLAFVAYVALLYHQRIRVFPLFQQSLFVGSLIFIYLGWMLVVYNLLGSRHYAISYLLGACTSALLWPWIFIVLRDLRRRTVRVAAH